MKIGRYDFEINENDVIFDNSFCYQLITRYCNGGRPRMSKLLFKKLLKQGVLYLTDERLEYTLESGKDIWYRQYKFDIRKLDDIG